MRGFNIFKNYVTKLEFNSETQNFEERKINPEEFEDQPSMIPEVPLALAFMMVGLQRPAKRGVRR